MKSIGSLLSLIISGALLSGCPHEEYSLKLSIKDGKLKRELTVVGQEMDVPKAELALLKKVYRKQPKRIAKRKYRVTGVFAGAPPDDLGGGGGRITKSECSMGRAYGYYEKFRGDEDLRGQIEARLVALDKFVDLWLDWLRHELGEEAGFDRLEGFVDTTLRRDLKLLSLYDWLDHITASKSADLFPVAGDSSDNPDDQAFAAYRRALQQEMDVRAFELAVARGYAQPTDLRFDAVFLFDLAFIGRAMIAGTGIDESSELARRLTELSRDGRKQQQSFEGFVRSTAEYRAFARNYRGSQKDDDVISAYLASLFNGLPLFSGSERDRLSISLATGVEPVETNGRWDPRAGVVRFDGMIAERADAGGRYAALPDIAYAWWAVPDTAAQRAKFGRVVLEDAPLLEYVHWYVGLSGKVRRQWDEVFARLSSDNIEELLTVVLDEDELPAAYAHDALQGLYTAVSGEEPPDLEQETEKGANLGD